MDSVTQSKSWRDFWEAANKAYQLARYLDAEKLYQKALVEVEKHAASDPQHEEAKAQIHEPW